MLEQVVKMATVDMSYEDMKKMLESRFTTPDFLDRAVDKYRGNPEMLAQIALHPNTTEMALMRIVNYLGRMESMKGIEQVDMDSIRAARFNAKNQLESKRRLAGKHASALRR